MKTSILDDHHDTSGTLDCFTKRSGHDVEVWNDHVQDLDALGSDDSRSKLSCSFASAPRSARRCCVDCRSSG